MMSAYNKLLELKEKLLNLNLISPDLYNARQSRALKCHTNCFCSLVLLRKVYPSVTL